jgi:parallel beta-helix repeat protein
VLLIPILLALTVCLIGAAMITQTLGDGMISDESPRQDEGWRYSGNQLSHLTEITFTPVSTIYLPVVSKSGNVYYVSTQGNDDNDGQTEKTAFRTIKQALEVVQPGEIILILPGTYSEALTLENAGSADAPITIRGESGKTVLDGQETQTISFWCENCTNFIFENLEIHSYTDIGIGVYQSSDIIMRNLIVHANGFDVQLVDWEIEGYGIQVDESQRITIENNEAYENGPPQPTSPCCTLGTGINVYGCTDCVIRNNNSHDNNGGGFLVEDSINVLVEGNEAIANYLDASADEWWDGGIWIDGGHDITVTNNLFQNNLGPGIEISDEDAQHPYGYVLKDNISTGNYYGIYIWNFGTDEFPPDNVLLMSNNQISGNIVRDVWIAP